MPPTAPAPKPFTCGFPLYHRDSSCHTLLPYLTRVALSPSLKHTLSPPAPPPPPHPTPHPPPLRPPLSRRLTQAYMRVQAGNYSLSPLVGSELRGKTVGVIGTGAIGVEACRIFKVRFGLRRQ